MLTYKLFISQSNNLDTVSNVEKNGTLAATGTDVSTLTADNLEVGEPYFYNVLAEDSVGKVIYEQNNVTLATADELPTDKPTITGVNPQINSVTVDYTGINNATSYQFRIDGGNAQQVSGNPFTVSNLDANTGYTVEVRGVNNTGAGPWSDAEQFTTDQVAPPQAPTITSVIPALDTAVATRTSVSGATGYDYRLNESLVLDAGVTNPYTVPNLAQNNNYTLEVRARNAGGDGDWSDIVSFTTDAEVTEEPVIDSVVNNSSINGLDVEFTPAEFATEHQWRVNGGIITTIGMSDSFQITDLEEGLQYDLELRGRNQYGAGPWTSVSTFILDSTPPTISDATLVTTDITEDGYTLSWTEATDNVSDQADIVYKVYEAIIGEEEQLNNVNTIETQIFKGSVIGTSTINITTGELFSTVNVLAEDEEGNKSIYAPTDVAVLDPQVNNVNIVDELFGLVEGDTNQNTYDFQVEVDTQDGADDTVTVTSSNTAIVTVSDLGGNMFRATLVEPVTESGTITLTAISNFDSFFTDTVNVQIIAFTFDDPNESNTREFEVLNV